MKYSKEISLLFLIIGLIGTQAYPTSCKGVGEEEVVLFPNPKNCSTYFECVYEELVLMPCPENLEWNDVAKQCDYPEIAQCKENKTLGFNSELPKKNWTSCEGVPVWEIVLLPNPKNCSTYIECTHGKPVILPCPIDLQWNDKRKRCDFPEIANCEEQKDNKTIILNSELSKQSCEGVQVWEIVLLPNPENCSTYIECTHEEPVVMPCPIGLEWNDKIKQCDFPEKANCKDSSNETLINSETLKKNWTSCEGVPEWEIVLLPTPGNCSTYIECTYEKPVVMSCPEGLHWNDAVKRCDYPEIAQCKETITNKTVEAPKYTSCNGVPSNINVLLPNPADCGSYIQCVHGSPMVRPCPAGLHWSVRANRCEWPEIANCKRNSCEGVPETEDVLLPNPEDCGSYLQCVHQQPMVRHCPAGLHWNVQANQCDWPANANCNVTLNSENSKKNWTSCEEVPEWEIVLFPTPGNCSTYIECTHGKPVVMVCPNDLLWNDAAKRCDYPEIAQCNETVLNNKTTEQPKYTSCNGVPSNIDVLLPNPADCGSYIQCVHGNPMVRQCPAGLHWSVRANRCEWPEVANCKRNSCEGVPETEDVLLPNPEDCGSYLQCVHQKPVVRSCPAGLHWNSAKNFCDWPNNANCTTDIPA